MHDERRYGDEEVAAIFEAAASPRSASGRARTADDGLTLAELQEIGREVGVEPARIAEAASALELRREGPLPRRTAFGIPIAVRHIVPLPRAPNDREWGILVGELRDAFHARGTDASRGELRGWTNGNLHAYVEPTESGWRLRLGTRKGNAIAYGQMGAAMLLFALFLVVVMLLGGKPLADLAAPALLAAAGLGVAGASALRLPGWAAERERQMAVIGERAQRLLAEPRSPADDGGASA